MVLEIRTIGNPMKMAAILLQFSMVLDKMAAILSKTQHHRKIECHGITKQRVAIVIQSAFGIPALTVFNKALDVSVLKK